MSEMGTAMIGTGEAASERRALRAAEGAIANPLFDDTSLKGARGVLISITGGKDLTLYEVDEAASSGFARKSTRKPTSSWARSSSPPSRKRCGCRSWRRASMGRPISGSNICAAQPSVDPLLHPGATPPARDQTARTAFGTVETHPPIAAVTEMKTRLFHRPSSHFQSRLSGGGILDEETRLNPLAIRRPTLLARIADCSLERRQASGWR